MSQDRVAYMLVAGLAGGCLGALSEWADGPLPYGLQMALDGGCRCLHTRHPMPLTSCAPGLALGPAACSSATLTRTRIFTPTGTPSLALSHWRSVLRARRSSLVLGIAEGELILNGEGTEDRAVEVMYQGELVSCFDALVAASDLFAPLQYQDEQEQEDTEGTRRAARVLHSQPFFLPDPPVERVLGSMPSVVTWQSVRGPPHGLGTACHASVYPSQWKTLRGPRADAAQEWSTEYRARYREPDVLETLEARRSEHNKDAGWRATIDTHDFRRKAPPAGAANASDTDSYASSECYVPEPLVLPGPGAYETEEALRQMRDRQRVHPGFGFGHRFSRRWSLPCLCFSRRSSSVFPLLSLGAVSRAWLQLAAAVSRAALHLAPRACAQPVW